jgi:hypothetical protein
VLKASNLNKYIISGILALISEDAIITITYVNFINMIHFDIFIPNFYNLILINYNTCNLCSTLMNFFVFSSYHKCIFNRDSFISIH